MKKKRRQQAITLMEIMVVIILIGIVSSALAYNLKGAMNKAKQFKTKENQKKITHVLSMQLLDGADPVELETNWKHYIDNDPLIQRGKNYEHLKDGWGQFFDVKIRDDGQILVLSKHLSEETTEEEVYSW